MPENETASDSSVGKQMIYGNYVTIGNPIWNCVLYSSNVSITHSGVSTNFSMGGGDGGAVLSDLL